MKKYLFLMMLGILTVTKANAAEQVLWEGDYNVSWALPDGDEHREWKGLGKDDFAAMEVGQKLYFYFSVISDTNPDLNYHKYNFDNWSWQALPGHEAEHADEFGFSEDTKVEFVLTQAIKDEIAANGFAIHGHGFHVKKVSKEVEQVLWEGDYNVSWNLDEGDEHKEWKGLGQDDFAAMEVGQKLYFYFSVTDDSYHKYNFDNWSWQALPGHEAEHAETFGFSEDTKVEFELTQAIKDEIAANGFAIHGHGFHVVKVSVANTASAATVSGTLASSGYTSLSSSYALNLSAITGATAYKVSSITASTITLTEVTEAVAASTGLILKGAAGAAYSIPVAASGTDISATNMLRAAVTATPLDDGTFYILKDGKFCLVTGAVDEAARTVPAGKAYLMKSDVSPAGARALSLAIDGEMVTGIETVRNGQQIGEFYNLSGQRVTAPQNGLYIVDGRKVIVK